MSRYERPSLVLLDIMMPRLDGIQVCRMLKADPHTRGIVVVMLSAQAQERSGSGRWAPSRALRLDGSSPGTGGLPPPTSTTWRTLSRGQA